MMMTCFLRGIRNMFRLAVLAGLLSNGDVRSVLALVQFARKALGMVATGSVLTSRYNAGGGLWEA
jgi:hypothetical protein